MRDIRVLLVLWIVQTTTVCSLPYVPDSDGKCRNTTTEYFQDGSSLCCKKCPPGYRMKKECSQQSDSECEKCGPEMYMENWNYAKNCFPCTRCKARKGLQISQTCSPARNSMCVCQPGKFCQMGFNDPYCTDCISYTLCKAGFGVSVPGTPNSNVKCEKCPSGSFSSVASYSDWCKPHTSCNGRAVISMGDDVSDTKCEEQIEPTVAVTTAPVVLTTVTTEVTTVEASSVFTTPHIPLNSSTAGQKTAPQRDTLWVTGVASVFGLLLLFALLFGVSRKFCKKDLRIKQPKVDANGNCESRDTIDKNYIKEPGITSFTAATPEQECLLEKVEVTSDQSQCSSNSETSTRMDGYSSHETIGPLQSNAAPENLTSALSEPRTLLSNTPPSSIPTQSSSQPTSPQVISPVTNSPHVNVNITLHIGNGSCGTPPFMPTDFKQAECSFGTEDESFSTPQQEAGEHFLTSVQESASNSTLELPCSKDFSKEFSL
ncbi:unnamed protein product [Menidia menidia]|uniref:(Atlantic silverside) hypothetical protein n=1 Tax=Menidia menidia TaxID=238744 RepID=A0A8S4BP03_9TELE|nr:unnamed protein product [Menidia menidia]